MKQQAHFWFVHAKVGNQAVNLAVSAFTERSARIQARKRLGLGKDVVIDEASRVIYAHAWVINHGWFPKAAHGAPVVATR